MNAQEFFLLARKVAERKAGREERDALEAVLKQRPELSAEYEDIKREFGVKVEPPRAGDPGGASLRRDGKDGKDDGGDDDLDWEDEPNEALPEPPRPRWLTWRFWLKAAVVTGVCALVFLPDFFRAPEAVMQLGVYGGTNAPADTLTREIAELRARWPNTQVRTSDDPQILHGWENDWPDVTPEHPLVKVIYDHTGRELRVSCRGQTASFSRVFAVEKDLTEALSEAHAFIQQQLR
jgi:hypothetical protein